MGTPEGILKKIIGTPKIYQSKQKISKKNCVSYLKSGKRPKICPEKIIRTSNQPMRTKFFPKKVCLVP
jgi:hypothetical protein